MNPGRQTKLAEVGVEGQARLVASSATVRARDPLSRAVEERYLAGTGMRLDASADTAHRGLADGARTELAAMHESARLVAEGAWNALDSVRAALAIGTGHGEKK